MEQLDPSQVKGLWIFFVSKHKQYFTPLCDFSVIQLFQNLTFLYHASPEGQSRSPAESPTVWAAPLQALAQLCPDW